MDERHGDECVILEDHQDRKQVLGQAQTGERDGQIEARAFARPFQDLGRLSHQLHLGVGLIRLVDVADSVAA